MTKKLKFSEIDYKFQVFIKNNINNQIWDTAGQEKYQHLAPLYYRGNLYNYKIQKMLKWLQLFMILQIETHLML